MKNNLHQGVVCPCPGVIYMYIANIFKALLLKKPMTNQSQISCEASLEMGKKVYINGPGHKTKMAATPIYIYGKKNFKNLLQNRKSYDLETWHAASGTQVLQSLFECWPTLRQGHKGSPIRLNGENC